MIDVRSANWCDGPGAYSELDTDEHQAVGWGCTSCDVAVHRSEDAGHGGGVQFAAADVDADRDHGAHHLVAEAARRDVVLEQISVAPPLGATHVPDRRSLPGPPAQGRKITHTEE